jgi:hypothetical protein
MLKGLALLSAAATAAMAATAREAKKRIMYIYKVGYIKLKMQKWEMQIKRVKSYKKPQKSGRR